MAARSKLCSSVSAWSGVFASIAMSADYSASVIVFAGYLLLLFFVSSKPDIAMYTNMAMCEMGEMDIECS